MAMLLVLETLTPTQRAVSVLQKRGALEALQRARSTGDLQDVVDILAPDVVALGDGAPALCTLVRARSIHAMCAREGLVVCTRPTVGVGRNGGGLGEW